MKDYERILRLRQRAEELLREKQIPQNDDFFVGIESLLEELNTANIELELQHRVDIPVILTPHSGDVDPHEN